MSRLIDVLDAPEINSAFLKDEEDTEVEQGFHKVFLRKYPKTGEDISTEKQWK